MRLWLLELGFAATQVTHAFVSHHHYDHIGDTGPCRALQALVLDCDVLVHIRHYLSGTALSKTFAAFTMGHRELAELAPAASKLD